MGRTYASELYIENLNLSVRSFNCLKRNNINTVEQLLEVTEDDLRTFKHLGTKSLGEIMNVISKIISGDLDFGELDYTEKKTYINVDIKLLDLIVDRDKTISSILFRDKDNTYKDDISIYDMELSVRCVNVLNKIQCTSAAKLLELRIDELNTIRNLGQKSKDEIIDKLKSLIYIVYSDEEIKETGLYEQIINSILKDYNDSSILANLNLIKENVYTMLKRSTGNIDLTSCNIEYLLKNDEFLSMIYSNNFLNELLKNYTVQLVTDKDTSLSFLEIRNSLPKHLQYSNVVINLLNNLIEEKKLEKFNGKYRIWYPTVSEYLNNLSNEREKIILTNRFKGKTLEEIGSELEVTRERIRQLEIKAIRKMPRLREDDYRFVFEKYDWTCELFKYCYDELEFTYGYLKSRYNKGNINIENFLEDDIIDRGVRIRAEKLIFKNYIIVGSSKIKKDRSNILHYILRTYCKDEVTCDELWDLYYMFLEDYGLENNEEMTFTKRYFETRLSNSNKVLWKLRKKLRYYDVSEISAKKIVETLKLDQLKDVEYSTSKFLRDYSEIMDEWDIRDEYELHNLMKKVISENNEYNINFGRMPIVEFGNADRNMQVLDVLLQTAPIEINEFAKVYEELYGVKAETVQANYLSCIEEYYHEGVYSIDYETLPVEQFNELKAKLVNDVYAISQVREIFIKLFPKGNVKLITTYNLKRLGFRVNSTIIYSEKYSNAEKCFRNIVSKKDIFDSCVLDSRILINQTYYVALQTLKENFDVVEFYPGQFINIRRLEHNGITKAKLQEYIDKVYDFIGSEVFTIKYLRKKGFSHELDDLGFEDWFYSSLLVCDNRFTHRRFDKERLLKIGKGRITLSDLVEHLVSKYRSIDIYDLIDYIKDEYGLSVDKFKIQCIAKDIDLYYDSIMEKVYIDYDEYFQEV